jgi:hypothetical protein
MGYEGVYWIVVAGYFKHDNKPSGISWESEETNTTE